MDRYEYSKLFERGELRRACSERGTPPQPPSRVNTTERLLLLREAMRNVFVVNGQTLDAYLVTSDDDHQVKTHSSASKFEKIHSLNEEL